MTIRAAVLAAVMALAASAATGEAQVVDTLVSFGPSLRDEMLCTTSPALSAPSRTPSAPAKATDTMYYMAPPHPRPAIDTTIVLSVERSDWSRDAYVAGMALGTYDLLHHDAPYTACAGVSLSLARASVALRGVHGLVHFHGDFRALEGVAGRARGSLFRPERSGSTPPVVPPRR